MAFGVSIFVLILSLSSIFSLSLNMKQFRIQPQAVTYHLLASLSQSQPHHHGVQFLRQLISDERVEAARQGAAEFSVKSETSSMPTFPLFSGSSMSEPIHV